MGNQCVSRTARRRAEDDRPVSAEGAARLQVLCASAQRLICALRTGSDETALREPVAAYVACAATCGISLQRVRDAVEVLVHEHAAPQRCAASGEPAARRHRTCDAAARRRQATNDLLELVLRLAREAGSGPTRQLREGL